MTFDTPFGKETDKPGKLAPTKWEVADNPGDYDGTSFDPVIAPIPNRAFRNFSFLTQDELDNAPSFSHWADWFKYDPEGALLYFKSTHEGEDLNLAGLSKNQKRKLGIK